ncbi:MAG: haloacid dehalogenase-like hydrolase [Gemmatimonadota bacterium]|nr:haloacid dehalogenase-like hydrolase [Gemmatimonadota bacterium]
MYLVLFDIDGTLLLSDGAGKRAFGGALVELFGPIEYGDYRFDGKTDPQIGRELLRMAGHADSAIDAGMARLMTRYVDGLRAEVAADGHHVHLLPGVRELLDALESRDDVVLGLLTGNVRDGATIKLLAAGLEPGRFRVGAFGSDHEHRPELPGVAQRRAREQLGVDVTGERMVVIGDTPADVECGRALGARAIAVATGRYTVEELRNHRPSAVFADLSDTRAVVRSILDA